MPYQVQDPGPAFISNTRARKLLGVGKTTLQRWRESGKLPYHKVGAIVFYRVADVNALIETGGACTPERKAA